MYIPSIAFEEMSGSAKGVTAAKMKSRKYIRNRGYGGSVRTSDQAKVKGIFRRLTTTWKTLTNEQILAWNKLALSQQGRSVLGTGAKISGSNLFTRLNYWIVACGGRPEVTPPTLLGVENPSSATIVCEGETFTFKLDQALADNGGIYLVIEATEGVNPNQAFGPVMKLSSSLPFGGRRPTEGGSRKRGGEILSPVPSSVSHSPAAYRRRL